MMPNEAPSVKKGRVRLAVSMSAIAEPPATG